MAKFESLPSIVTILVYYAFLFIALNVIYNASIVTMGFSIPDYSFEGNNFLTNTSFNGQVNPFNTQARCMGVGKSMNFIGNIRCYDLNINIEDSESCNAIDDCEWQNGSTFLLIFDFPRGCSYGFVNKTIYNITSDLAYSNKYCTAQGLQTIGMCKMFGCTWISAEDQMQSSQDYTQEFSTASIWQTISWVLTFRFDFGFDSFINILVNFIFTVLIPLILFALIYYMFVPF
jgi:hypothetical protein